MGTQTEHTDASHVPSIFNDVIGPVMRGPSSSHCAASVRIGRMARDLMDGDLQEVRIEFDVNGSLATTHESQGSDMGLFGGLLGWDAWDARLTTSAQALREAGVKVEIQISDYGASHPNTYKLTLCNAHERRTMTAISTGGGMIQVIEIDGVPVSMQGDYYETLIYVRSFGPKRKRPQDDTIDGAQDDKGKNQDDKGKNGVAIVQDLRGWVDADAILLRLPRLPHQGAGFVEVKSQRPLPEEVLAQIRAKYAPISIKTLAPVLPVRSHKAMRVPFSTCAAMLDYNKDKALDLWELAVHYERARGNLSHEDVVEKMEELVRIMRTSILEGIEGTEYEDRILGHQSGTFQTRMADHQLLDGGILNRITLYVTAMMEMKSAMGVIIAAPTAGACGGLPGACLGAADALGLSLDEAAKAMLAAGLIGVFIATHATFAAEVGGCQAECGAGSGMAAGALVTLAGGTTPQAINAASMALQNILGMTCDPVANRVEVPCLGKNVMAAANALTCANMALADFDPVIPLDEVIETMDRVGKSLPRELRCTALGGLSITPTSKAIERNLNGPTTFREAT
jgi:L-serine dehydratase